LLREVSSFIEDSGPIIKTSTHQDIERLPGTIFVAETEEDYMGLESDGDDSGLGEDGNEVGRIPESKVQQTIAQVRAQISSTWRPMSKGTALLKSTAFADAIELIAKKLECTADIDYKGRKILLKAQEPSKVTQVEESLNVFEEQLETCSTPAAFHTVLDEERGKITMRMTGFAQTPQKFHLTTLDEIDPPSKLKVREYLTLRFYTMKAGQAKDAAIFKPWSSLSRSRKDPTFCLWINYRYPSTGASEWYEDKTHSGTAKGIEMVTSHIPPDKTAAVKAWRAEMSFEGDTEAAQRKNRIESIQWSDSTAENPKPVIPKVTVLLDKPASTDQPVLTARIPRPIASIEESLASYSRPALQPEIALGSKNFARGPIRPTRSRGALASTSVKVPDYDGPATVTPNGRVAFAKEKRRDANTADQPFLLTNNGSKTYDQSFPPTTSQFQPQVNSLEIGVNESHGDLIIIPDWTRQSDSKDSSSAPSRGLYENDLLDSSPEEEGIPSSLYHPLIPTSPFPSNVSTKSSVPELIQEIFHTAHNSNKDSLPSGHREDKVIETRQQVSEVSTRSFRNTMGQRGPSMTNLASTKEFDDTDRSTIDFVIEILRKGKKYRGELNLQIDIGRILVFRCPVEASENQIGGTEMLRVLNHQSLTSFTSM
jgi:hypothetical protein